MDRQREDGHRLIELRGWRLIEEFVDNDISAAGKARRPGFDAMLDAITSQRIDVVVAWSLDRLTRNRRDQLRLIENCQRFGVNLALVRGSDIDMSSAIGRGVADIMSATARIEIEQKSERQIRANRQAAEQGRMVGGRRAFGYTPNGLSLHPVEAPLLVHMYELFLTGSPLGSVARWLNELGVTTARGNRWRTETVRVVLANPRNAGKRAMRPVNPQTGRREFYHEDPVADGNWPAVVAEETWRAVLQILRDPTRRSSPGNQPRYLLSGLARCGWADCGAPMFTSHHHGIRTLRCSTRRHVSRRADYIEAFVEEQAVGYFRGPGRESLPVARPAGADLQVVRVEAAQLRAQLRGLAVDYADRILDRSQVAVAGERLRTQLAELEEIVAAAGRVDVTASLRAAEDPEEVWDAMPLATKREVLRQIAAITVLPGSPGQLHGQRFHKESVRIVWPEG